MVEIERLPSPPYRAFGLYRLALAASVVCGHAAWLTAADRNPVANLLGARNAVLMFFVLSGFVLTEAAATYYRGRPEAFAMNRALKILPGFVAALFISFLLHGVIASDGRLLQGLAFEHYVEPPPQIWGAGNLLVNLLSVLPFTDIDVGKRVFGDGLYLFVRYIWAVNVEVLFYACVFAVIVTKSTRDITRWLLPAVVAILALVVSRNYYIYAPFFMLGALLWYSERSRHWTVIAAVTLCFVAIAVSPAVGNLRSMLLIAIWTGAMMALSRLRLSSRWRRLDNRLGDLSYPLYLNHYAVLVAFSAYAEARSFYLWLFAIFASLVLAGLVHHLVERPLFSVRAAIRLSSSTRATRIGSTEVTA